MKLSFEKLCDMINDDAKELNRVWHYVVKHKLEFTSNQIRFLNDRLNEIGAKVINNEVIKKEEQIDLLMIRIADCRWEIGKLNECYDYATSIEDDLTQKEREYLGEMFWYCYQDIIDREQQEYEQLKKEFKMQHSNKEYNAALHTRKKR